MVESRPMGSPGGLLDADFGVALNKTVDLLDSKITKEKEKAQEK